METYLLLAKGAKGKACAQLVQDVLAAPGLYVFGELLSNENVQKLIGTEHQPWFDLLEIFAYGTLNDLPSTAILNQAQRRKLLHLTLISLSSSRTLAYDMLLVALQLQNVRQLEDLIIDAIYAEVITGKLDQQNRQFVVSYSIGRDLKPDQVEGLALSLAAWYSFLT